MIASDRSLAAFVAALLAFVGAAGLVVFGGFKSSPDRTAAALSAVQTYVHDLNARDYGAACSLHAKAFLPKPASLNGISYTPEQTCALSFAINEVQSILFFQTPIFDKFSVRPQPVVDKTHSVPANGYVFRAAYSQGVVYVGVQRDAAGEWRVVSVES